MWIRSRNTALNCLNLSGKLSGMYIPDPTDRMGEIAQSCFFLLYCRWFYHFQVYPAAATEGCSPDQAEDPSLCPPVSLCPGQADRCRVPLVLPFTGLNDEGNTSR
jgi:hypothetical protein